MTLLDRASCGGDPPFVWLHGFTQTAQSGYEFQRHVRALRNICPIDLPGHGTRASVALDLPSTADVIASDIGSRPIDLGGYSFGGRVALHVAARNPTVLRRLVLLSTTAGLSDPDEREARRRSDEALAAHCEEIGAVEFLREWTSQPLFASLPPDPVEHATRSTDTAGLANSLRMMGTGTQLPLDESLRRCQAPTLILAGSQDEKFVREAHRLHACFANSRVVIVPDAGHAAHLERPQYVADVVSEFLREKDEGAEASTDQ